MQVSVVIPTHNRVEVLSRALDSVIQQSHPAAEIIVVDDGSTDATTDLVTRHYPQVTLVQQSNHGVSHARNRGIETASSEWIALLDSDDGWLPNKLEMLAAAQLKQTQLKLFHSEEIWIRNGQRVNAMNKHKKRGGWIFHHCLPLCVISPSAALLHRSLFDELGLFDENLPACEDYDMWLRVCSRYPVGFVDTALITKYGGHADQLSRRHWGMDRFRIRSLHRLLQQQILDHEQYQLAVAMLVKKCQILLQGAHKHRNQHVIDEFQPLLDSYRELTC